MSKAFHLAFALQAFGEFLIGSFFFCLFILFVPFFFFSSFQLADLVKSPELHTTIQVG